MEAILATGSALVPLYYSLMNALFTAQCKHDMRLNSTGSAENYTLSSVCVCMHACMCAWRTSGRQSGSSSSTFGSKLAPQRYFFLSRFAFLELQRGCIEYISGKVKQSERDVWAALQIFRPPSIFTFNSWAAAKFLWADSVALMWVYFWTGAICLCMLQIFTASQIKQSRTSWHLIRAQTFCHPMVMWESDERKWKGETKQQAAFLMGMCVNFDCYGAPEIWASIKH